MIIQKTHRNSFNFMFFFVDSGEKKLCCMDFKQVASYSKTKQSIHLKKKKNTAVFK